MQRTLEHIRAIVSRILFIGVSVQILLGLLWMLLAFDGRQDFVESAYTEWLESALSGFPYEPVVYLIQLGVAFFAGYQLLEGLGARTPFWKIWGSLALLTYPYAMQCHMAILPDSLAFSFFLLVLASGLKGRKIIYLFWLFSALFLPEYLYFGAVPTAVFLWMSAKKHGSFRKIGTELLVVGLVVIMVLGFHKFSSTEHDSLEEAWFRRTAWSSMYQFYPHWPEEVTAAITGEEYNAIRTLPENMSRILLPKVKKILGEEYARKWCGEFGTFVFKANRQQILLETLKDAGGYVMPIVFVELRLDGKGGASYCDRNYEIMRQSHPFWTGCYVQYAAWWFVIGMFCVALMLLVRVSSSRWENVVGCCVVHQRWWIWGVGLMSGLLMVVWYTLQSANLWDPKKALFVGCLWMLWMVENISCCSEKEKTPKCALEKEVKSSNEFEKYV